MAVVITPGRRAVDAQLRGRIGRRVCASMVAGIALAFIVGRPGAATAHETDQFTLPLGREFADLRVPISRLVEGALVEAVNETNAAIQGSLRDGHPNQQTEWLQSSDFIASKVWARLLATFPTNEGLDNTLAGTSMHARYPGLITDYRAELWIYDDPLLLADPTKVVRTFFRAATINVGGTLIGTDKIIHFIHLGRIYHSTYLGARQRGLSESKATAEAVQVSSGANLFLSENTLLGMLTTGIYSNADLSANYAGFKFYRNLTETVRIGDRVLPPMLVRDGLFWRADDHVRPESDFFTAFVTPHWNEALNPNSYAAYIGPRVRKMLRERCADVLDWYTDERGNQRTQQEFASIERDLSTWYGESYGYRDDGKDTVSIAATCFPLQQAGTDDSASAAAVARATPGAPEDAKSDDAQGGSIRSQDLDVDRFGRTPLWWSARDGKIEEVERLLAEGADPNAADIDGETPLHAAAATGRVAVVEALLAHGADPHAKALYGTTPLHVAVEESELAAVQVLLSNGSDANARDVFGQSPLHEAAFQGNRELVALLLDYGADPNALDGSARTPVQLAAHSGNDALVKWLASYAQGPSASAGQKAGASGPRQPAEPGYEFTRVGVDARPAK